MDAVGAVASIIGLAGAGAKISLTLFDLAKKIGSAGDEMRSTGVEISLFCAVLKQLERTLGRLSRKRYSISAIDVTQQVLDHCADIFRKLDHELNELAKQVEWKARLKWVTSSKSKFQMHRGTLESCKLTLQIMLSTLNFAETVSSRRASVVDNAREEEEEELVAASLIAAYQDSIERLQEIEKEAALLQSEDGETAVVDDEPPRYSKRASAWLQSLGVSHPLDSSNRNSVSSTSSARSQISELLARWTDQGPHWSELQALSHRNSYVATPTATLADVDPFTPVNWQRSFVKESLERRTTEASTKLSIASGSRMDSGSTISRTSPTDTTHKRINDTISGLGISTEPVAETIPEGMEMTPRPRYGMPERGVRKKPPAPLNLESSRSTDVKEPLSTPSPIVASFLAKRKNPYTSNDLASLSLRDVPRQIDIQDNSAPESMYVKAWCDFEAGSIPGSSKSTDLSFSQGDIVEINTQMSPYWSFNRDAASCFDCWLDARIRNRRGQVPARALVPVWSPRKGSILEAQGSGVIEGIYIFMDLSLHREFIEKQAQWSHRKQVWRIRQNGGYSMEHNDVFSKTLPPWPEYSGLDNSASPPRQQIAESQQSPVSCSMRVTSSDTVEAIKASTLLSLGLLGKVPDYDLLVAYGHEKRVIEVGERPLMIYKQLQKAGKSPFFLIQDRSERDVQ